MKVVRELREWKKECAAGLSVALGAFDGLHLGHRKVIEAAKTPGLSPAVFTFRDDPSVWFGAKRRDLLTEDDRLAIFARWGVETVFLPEFREVAEMEPETFLRMLREDLGAARVCCGADFRFGKGAAGNVETLRAAFGEGLTVAPTVEYSGAPVSATRIRDAVERGGVEEAAAMLGRPFGFALPVVHGNRIGRTMGTPTANQHFPEGFVLPRFGVYAAVAELDGGMFCGVTNVGVKPTVGSDAPLAETWLPEFSGDLYGKTLRLHLLRFLRPERKFESLDALREEIRRNALEAEKIFREWKAWQN